VKNGEVIIIKFYSGDFLITDAENPQGMFITWPGDKE
jgi:hypothetical protein